MAVKRLAFFKH